MIELEKFSFEYEDIILVRFSYKPLELKHVTIAITKDIASEYLQRTILNITEISIRETSKIIEKHINERLHMEVNYDKR